MDKYDKAIAYLEKNPDEILTTWLEATLRLDTTDSAECLFFPLGRMRTSDYNCGCLTQIKAREAINASFKNAKVVAEFDGEILHELMEEILNDGRIPKKGEDITVNHLHVFAEYQRKYDKITSNHER